MKALRKRGKPCKENESELANNNFYLIQTEFHPSPRK
jgi:hypothetical protein